MEILLGRGKRLKCRISSSKIQSRRISYVYIEKRVRTNPSKSISNVITISLLGCPVIGKVAWLQRESEDESNLSGIGEARQILFL